MSTKTNNLGLIPAAQAELEKEQEVSQHLHSRLQDARTRMRALERPIDLTVEGNVEELLARETERRQQLSVITALADQLKPLLDASTHRETQLRERLRELERTRNAIFAERERSAAQWQIWQAREGRLVQAEALLEEIFRELHTVDFFAAERAKQAWLAGSGLLSSVQAAHRGLIDADGRLVEFDGQETK